MRQFNENEQRGFRLMIQHEAWINTGMLAIVLLSAYVRRDQTSGYIASVGLFLVWSLYRMQRRELDNNAKWLFSGLSVMQTTILIIATVEVGRTVMRLWRWLA